MSELIKRSIVELGLLLSANQVTPIEVLRDMLGQISAVESRINAFITVAADEAMSDAVASATRLQRRESRGPLDGVPVAVKDNIQTRGIRTTAGSRILADNIPVQDATVVSRLRKAGAIIIGKTNMHEFGMGGTSLNPHFGAVINPWDRSRIAAGSSGGSGAAVAARECPAALGTDTGGSIRLPASVNGVTGIRPSFGRVSKHGVVPLAWSSDTVGPICRTVTDCGILLQILAGFDPVDTSSANVLVPSYGVVSNRPLIGVRIGLVEDFTFLRLAPAVEGALRQALVLLESLGAGVVPVTISELEHSDVVQFAVELSEAASYHEEWIAVRPHDYGADVLRLLEAGRALKATEYIDAQRYRSMLRAQFAAAFSEVDVIVGATTPLVAPFLGQEQVDFGGTIERMETALFRFAHLASQAGLPSMSLPCGFSPDGLPIGLQITGPRFGEPIVFRVGTAYQEVTDWHLRSPAKEAIHR